MILSSDRYFQTRSCTIMIQNLSQKIFQGLVMNHNRTGIRLKISVRLRDHTVITHYWRKVHYIHSVSFKLVLKMPVSEVTFYDVNNIIILNKLRSFWYGKLVNKIGALLLQFMTNLASTYPKGKLICAFETAVYYASHLTLSLRHKMRTRSHRTRKS